MLRHIGLWINIISFILLLKCISLFAICPTSNTTGSLTFSKKPNELDYFQIPNYGQISCCIHGYDSLLWYKNNTLLVASNIKFLDENQTVGFITTSPSEEGVYMCIARKGNLQINHTIYWYGQYQPPIDKNAVRFIEFPNKINYRKTGDSILLTCEVNFGIDSNYYDPKIKWGKNGLSQKELLKLVNISESYSNKEKTILKSNLYIDVIREDHFGDYWCKPRFERDTNFINHTSKLANGDDPETLELRQHKVTSFSTLSVFIFIIILGTMMIILWRLDIQVFWHTQYGHLEIDDGKDIDVLISYSKEDEVFAKETLQNHLENILHFKCLLHGRDISLGENILDYTTESLARSRRFAVILSPHYLTNGFLTYTFKCALHEMIQKNIKIFFILYKDILLTSIGSENDEPCLRKSIGVIKKIRWPENKKQLNRFWKNIILQLPPKPNQTCLKWIKSKLIHN